MLFIDCQIIYFNSPNKLKLYINDEKVKSTKIKSYKAYIGNNNISSYISFIQVIRLDIY